MKSKILFRTAVISQVLAIFTHAYLTYSHYGFIYGLTDYKGLCNISDYFNCDSASASSYSAFLGVPLAVWGLMTNLALLLVLFICATSTQKSALKFLSRVLSSYIAAISVVMMIITFTQLTSVCPFCFVAYILSFITAGALWLLPKENAETPFQFSSLFASSSNGGILNTVLLVVIGVPALSFLLNSMVTVKYATGYDQAIQSSLQDWLTGKDHLDLASVKGLTKGAEVSKAKMVIVEFADFQCIHCKTASPVLNSFVRSKKDVTLIFLSFPLDGNCNPKIQRKGDGKSCEYAKAVHCANQQGKGWEMHDWIFDNFGNADLSAMSDHAQKVGIEIEAFRACRESEETQNAILAQAELGDKVGIQGTPTVFVNGRYLPRGNLLLVLEAAYRKIQ